VLVFTLLNLRPLDPLDALLEHPAPETATGTLLPIRHRSQD
jgi:hypothetical protein